MEKTNVVLIGMPGSGKSTVGVLLAKVTGRSFVDTDLLIQEQEGRLLSEIMETEGLSRFLAIENEVNAALRAENSVIAPGGSVIYGARAMEHFKETARIIYLKLSYESVAMRLGDLKQRGVALRPGQDLKSLYEERCPLYEKYADEIVCCDGLNLSETLDKVKEQLDPSISAEKKGFTKQKE